MSWLSTQLQEKNKRMTIKVFVLGSGGVMPTVNRNCTALYCKTNYSNFLLDAGEGFQKQLQKANLPFYLDFIVISHLHLDHLVGLLGYLSTSILLKREKPLRIYCPDPSYFKNLLENLRKGFFYDLTWVSWIKILPCVEYMEKDLTLEFFKVDHSITCFGVKITSINNISYDKDKLQKWGSRIEINQLIKEGSFFKEGVFYNKDQFVSSSAPHFRVIYSGDTTIKNPIWEMIDEPALVFHQCTHYFKEDENVSSRKKHTHYNELCKKTWSDQVKIVLVHLGSKITPDFVKKINSKMLFSEDGMCIEYGLKDNIFKVK